MDGKGSILDLLAKRMEWLGHRQSVIANNIANADTPKFVPKDLPESEFRKVLGQQTGPRLEPRATQSGHIQPAAARQTGLRPVEAPDIYETSPSGNAVVIEEQMVKMNQVQVSHGLAVSLYKKHLTLIRMALRGPS